MKISVITPTCHRNQLLAKCLDYLAPGVQTLAADQYEVIVSDDGSKSTAEQMIRERYPWAKWVAGPRRGPSANRNNGAKYAKGEWIAFTDDDCLPEPQWLLMLMDGMLPGMLAIEGAIKPLGNLQKDMADCPINLSGGCFWSANIAIKSDLFADIGGFDENYPFAAHEDVDLYIRLLSVTKVTFIVDALVYHPVRYPTFWRELSLVKRRAVSLSYHFVKHKDHLGYKRLRDFFIAQCMNHLSLVRRYMLRRRYKQSMISMAWLLFGIPMVTLHVICSPNKEASTYYQNNYS